MRFVINVGGALNEGYHAPFFYKAISSGEVMLLSARGMDELADAAHEIKRVCARRLLAPDQCEIVLVLLRRLDMANFESACDLALRIKACSQLVGNACSSASSITLAVIDDCTGRTEGFVPPGYENERAVRLGYIEPREDGPAAGTELFTNTTIDSFAAHSSARDAALAMDAAAKALGSAHTRGFYRDIAMSAMKNATLLDDAAADAAQHGEGLDARALDPRELFAQFYTEIYREGAGQVKLLRIGEARDDAALIRHRLIASRYIASPAFSAAQEGFDEYRAREDEPALAAALSGYRLRMSAAVKTEISLEREAYMYFAMPAETDCPDEGKWDKYRKTLTDAITNATRGGGKDWRRAVEKLKADVTAADGDMQRFARSRMRSFDDMEPQRLFLEPASLTSSAINERRGQLDTRRAELNEALRANHADGGAQDPYNEALKLKNLIDARCGQLEQLSEQIQAIKRTSFIILFILVFVALIAAPYALGQYASFSRLPELIYALAYVFAVALALLGCFAAAGAVMRKRIRATVEEIGRQADAYFGLYIKRIGQFRERVRIKLELTNLEQEAAALRALDARRRLETAKRGWHNARIQRIYGDFDHFSAYLRLASPSDVRTSAAPDIDYENDDVHNGFYWPD